MCHFFSLIGVLNDHPFAHFLRLNSFDGMLPRY
uniref:Uncharacterized protein n=1 Tax=Rhizophora mucronata TaxID=61149 RepID=A0A2P2R0Q9_RHIMU